MMIALTGARRTEDSMKRTCVWVVLVAAGLLSSCSKQDTGQAPLTTAAGSAATAGQAGGATHATIHLQDGSKFAGTIVASTATDMVVDGDDGIERKIPLGQVKSVDYNTAPVSRPATA